MIRPGDIEIFLERSANGLAIRDRQLPFHPQAERENFPGNEGKMGVENITEQDLGAGVDDGDSHRELFAQAQGLCHCEGGAV